MRTTDALRGLECLDCEELFDPAAETGRCPDCGGILDPVYDYGAVSLSLDDGAVGSMWRYDDVLPFPADVAATLAEGGTPLVPAPTLAASWDVGEVWIKDEGRNPTGTFKDRGQTVAVTAAVEHGAEDVALASAGNAGQAAAAYAATAGVDAHVFLPERAGFTQKAMVEVHGGDLTVADPMKGDSQIGDAGGALETALAEHDWHPVQTFVTPYRHEGKKTMGYEILEQLDWEVPDGVVYPTGGGVGLVGIHKAARELRELGYVEELPGMYAAQSTGCAPIVDAYEAGHERHEPWDDVETICGGIAIPDPGASDIVLDAIRESDGGAVATDDDDILDAALEVARRVGVEMPPTCASAVSGAAQLAAEREFGPDDTVVILNTGAGNKDADVLRSHVGRRRTNGA
jgi:threonine synthase